MISAYPLQFPFGWRRNSYPSRARFGDHSIAYADGCLRLEIKKLGGTGVVVSSNLRLKNDGTPFSSQSQPSDCGVAVYFTLNGRQQCFPCDRWDRVEHNLWAIYCSIEALRGLERWGAKDMVEAAFQGFQALPSPEMVSKPRIDYFSGMTTLEAGKMYYQKLLMTLHPDKGGNPDEFIDMQKQWERFKESKK